MIKDINKWIFGVLGSAILSLAIMQLSVYKELDRRPTWKEMADVIARDAGPNLPRQERVDERLGQSEQSQHAIVNQLAEMQRQISNLQQFMNTLSIKIERIITIVDAMDRRIHNSDRAPEPGPQLRRKQATGYWGI